MDRQLRTLVGAVGTGIGAILVLVVIFGSWVNIPPGTVGVLFDKMRGGVRSRTLGEGWRFKIPIIQWVQEYPVALRTYTDTGDGSGMISLPTEEGQHILQQLSVVYNVKPDQASHVFDEFQGADIDTIEHTFVHQTIQAEASNITGVYSLMDIYGPKKLEIQTKIEAALRNKLESWGFNVDRVNLGSAKFPESIETSLQQKIQAQQDAEKARFKLSQAEIDAKARIAQAEGEAKANQLVRQQITPELIRLRSLEVQAKAVDKWSGKLPDVLTGGSIPFITLSVPSKESQK